MQITRETDYAVRCLLHLSEHPDRIIPAGVIVKTREIPKSFLSKIIQKLAKAGIIKSFRGANGGVRLARKPGKISLLDVIQSIEGDIGMNQCALDSRACNLSSRCSVHPVWVDIRKKTERILRSYKFDKLINREDR